MLIEAEHGEKVFGPIIVIYPYKLNLHMLYAMFCPVCTYFMSFSLFALLIWRKWRNHHPILLDQEMEIFSTVNRVSLHTSRLHYLLSTSLIWLKYCWRDCKSTSYPSISIYICQALEYNTKLKNYLNLCLYISPSHWNLKPSLQESLSLGFMFMEPNLYGFLKEIP